MMRKINGPAINLASAYLQGRACAPRVSARRGEKAQPRRNRLRAMPAAQQLGAASIGAVHRRRGKLGAKF